MRKLLSALTFLLFFILSVSAQSDLSGSRRKSVYTYVYRVPETEARALYRSGMKDWQQSYQHTLVDSFPAEQEAPSSLSPGNYLFVKTVDNRLSGELRTIGPLRCDWLNNGHDMALSLHTPEGAVIDDARVFLHNRKIPYDPATGVYTLGRQKGSYVRIDHKGVFYYFPLRTGAYGRPVSFWQRWQRWWQRIREGDPYHAHSYENRFRAFVVVSKPKYKPGDTVEGKAFIMDRRGHPIDRPLWLRVRGEGADTVLGKLHPYRSGGYIFSFVLNDSLHLRLDEEYHITLEGSDRRGADEDKVVTRGRFHYEEYNLQSIRFDARTDRQKNSPGEPVSLYLRAVDENDLPVPDGRVEIQVLTSARAGQFSTAQLFLADTLWKVQRPLDPLGETRIDLPDSIFPSASFSYTIHCVLLNSDNEYRTQDLYQHYLADTGQIFFRSSGDSLAIDYRVRGHSRPVAAMLYAFSKDGDTIAARRITLPGSFSTNPYTARYSVWTVKDSVYGVFQPALQQNVGCTASRTRDSVVIESENPDSLNFWYAIRAGNSVIQRGYGRSLHFAAHTVTSRPYVVTLQYITSGSLRKNVFTVPFRDKLLQVDLREPSFIYPGQTVTIGIGVKDADGRPVADADLTAYSYTTKFGDHASPGIPYLGKTYTTKRPWSGLMIQPNIHWSRTSSLNWSRWSRELGLDTIEYYKFLHPSAVYVNREPARDGKTQIAPFVSRKGDLQPVHQLYIDERPVFFNQAEQLNRYSFYVTPGPHSFRIRTTDRMIRLDSFWISRGMKTFICIQDDSSNKVAHILPMPDTLTRKENELWSRYMILVDNSFSGHFASIVQGGDRLYLLNQQGVSGYNSLLAGPLTGELATLRVKDGYKQVFEPEGGYRFQISQGLIREKQLSSPYPFNKYLSKQLPSPDFHDWVLTEKDVDSLWQDYLDERSAQQDLFRNTSIPKTGNGALQIKISGVGTRRPEEQPFIRKIFLFRYDDPDFLRIYKGNDRYFGYVPPGVYRVLLLLKGDRYVMKDSIRVRMNGLNYYAIGDSLTVHARDSFSIRISQKLIDLEQKENPFTDGSETDSIRTFINEQYLDPGVFHRLILGRVIDNKGNPLAGATVTIKGTRHGTVTGMDGRFRLSTPDRGTLTFAYIGFASVDRAIGDDASYGIQLHETTSFLNDVVVIGYGTSRRRELTGSVSTIAGYNLEGKVAGVLIRGSSSSEAAGPLIIVDGLPYSGKMEQLDPAIIEKMQILKPSEAMGIYGQNAAGGAILVTTKKAAAAETAGTGETPPTAANSLRRHFRDDAFWQPQLRTDINGEASFSVRYPDDITNWQTHVLAVTDHRQTGFAQGTVKSFKALSAGLNTPVFLVEGDSARVLGKILNYMPDTVNVRRRILIDGAIVADTAVGVHIARIDTFLVRATKKDSLLLQYTLQKRDGYFDGEERSIPVFAAGVKETKGVFGTLEGDTTLRLSFDTSAGMVSVYASSSVLPVLLDEIEQIRQYKYLCNEQLASKLMALLQKKKVYHYLGKEFREEKNIPVLIDQLFRSRGSGALWGWWANTQPSVWVSLHVTEALLEAEWMGYTIRLDKQSLTNYLVYTVEGQTMTDRLRSLRLLEELHAKVDLRKYLDTIERHLSRPSLYEKLLYMETRQAAGLEVRLDTMVAKRQLTVFGNWYWGEDNRNFFDNPIQNTLLMYRLLRQEGGYVDTLKKIRNYFLEKRREGRWRNTYESCLILETLLPDLLEGDSAIHTPTLVINGGAPIGSYPYEGKFPPRTVLQIGKKGNWPVYFTAWQQYWNTAPQKTEGEFAVHSFFERNGQPIAESRLKAGQPVVLQIDVRVKADAEYIMIEIPIPAGCSYLNKDAAYANNEVHREYFKNKVSIFCRSLDKGVYRFSVALLPRYTGSYLLNPARAEMMYFPVFYGREGMKKVGIE